MTIIIKHKWNKKKVEKLVKFLYTAKARHDPMTQYMKNELNKETLYFLLQNPKLFANYYLYQQFIELYFPELIENHPNFTQALIHMAVINGARKQQQARQLRHQKMYEINYQRLINDIRQIRQDKRIKHTMQLNVDLNKILRETTIDLTTQHEQTIEKTIKQLNKAIEENGLIEVPNIKQNKKLQEKLTKLEKQIIRENKRLEKNKTNRILWQKARLLDDKYKPTYKVWNQHPNPKTRHNLTDGQKVKLEEKFIVINDKTGDIDYVDYPGDWTCSPSNSANCLCSLSFTNDPTGYKPHETLNQEKREKSEKIQKENQFRKDKRQYLIQNEELPDYIRNDSEYTFSRFGNKLFIKLNLNKRMRKIGDKYNDNLYNRISKKFNTTLLEYEKIEGTLKHKAIHIWTGNKHEIFNQWIKRGKEALFNKVPIELEEDTHKLFKDIKNELIAQEVPIDTDIVVFKGTSEEIGIHLEGNKLKFTEFTATSLNEQTAKNFIRNKNGKRYIYEIHVPKGTKIIPILQQGRHPHQSEILFSEEHTFIEGQRYNDPSDENTIRVPILLTS